MSEPNKCIVFGATGGIDAELCKRLHADGAKITIAGRDQEKLAGEIDADFDLVDVTKPQQVNECVEQASRKYEHINGIASGSIALVSSAAAKAGIIGLVISAAASYGREW